VSTGARPSKAAEAGATPGANPPAGDDGWPIPWQAVWGTQDDPGARLVGRIFVITMALLRRAPGWTVRAAIEVLARVAKVADRQHSRAARVFLRQALGELSPAELERRVVQAYRHLFHVVADAQRFGRRFPGQRAVARFDVQWTDAARAALEARQGCLLVTGHIGNWEAALTIAPWLGFSPMYVVSRPPKNAMISRAIQAERESRRVRLIPRRGAMAHAPAILRAGGSLALMLDQRARGRALSVPFFGRPARCDRSAGVLMKRLRVPAIVGACFETGEPMRYRIRFYDVLQPTEIRAADLETITARINHAYERMIQDAPEQYFWLHDRYKDTPGEEPAEEDADDAGPAGFSAT
jgi:KDO2-lipid IV(A) lauroyltransferase